MRILQLIDTLNSGGAERMALNYFLAVKKCGFESYIAVSREEGFLAEQIRYSPGYKFLKKSNAADLLAFYKLKKIISLHKIDIIQAHGSSWFWAVLCKISGSKIKVVWHDHFGDSENLDKRKSILLKKASRYFDGIISVNNNLRNWAKHTLKFKKPLIYLPNFVNQPISLERKVLRGDCQFKIVCVANLRPQKDHFTLIKAFKMIQHKFDVSLHLFGRHSDDAYFFEVKTLVENNPGIFYDGEVSNVMNFLADADMGVLSSNSEGLPLALLEYGMAGIPVICTKVGECSNIIEDDGFLVEANKPEELAAAMKYYLENREKSKQDSINFNRRIKNDYSEEAILSEFQKFISKI
ncbi:glycosyltransferase family 4 protein [Christiangramia crocea]|uniref:Glycosyltransferase family 4 protein n=1 Tax=Christiangramia crocea TaxID=2904124 RepID=A0A9X1UZA8_9FLAO|nr:glycosyltransferase family 4 protein [Gramella crocea]MCG9973043.1 glycosyltransferase family 4 protein [Gramella crocea]